MSSDIYATTPEPASNVNTGKSDTSKPIATSKQARFYEMVPPPGLVLLSILAIQLGAALATQLFPVLGASGTVAMRIIISQHCCWVLSLTAVSPHSGSFSAVTGACLAPSVCASQR